MVWRVAIVTMVWIVSAAGCFTTRKQVHAAGPFVKAISAQHGGVVVERCAIRHVDETKQECFSTILAALFLQPFGGASSSYSYIEEGSCTTSVIPTRGSP